MRCRVWYALVLFHNNWGNRGCGTICGSGDVVPLARALLMFPSKDAEAYDVGEKLPPYYSESNHEHGYRRRGSEPDQNDRIEDVSRRLETTDRDLKELNQKVGDVRVDVAAIRVGVDCLSDALSAARVDAKETKTELATSIESTRTEIKKTKKELTTSMEETKKELTDQIQEAKVDLTASMEKTKTDLTDFIKATKAELSKDIAGIKGDIAGIKGDIAGINDTIAGLKELLENKNIILNAIVGLAGFVAGKIDFKELVGPLKKLLAVPHKKKLQKYR